jgi:hypothetical protein
MFGSPHEEVVQSTLPVPWPALGRFRGATAL